MEKILILSMILCGVLILRGFTVYLVAAAPVEINYVSDAEATIKEFDDVSTNSEIPELSKNHLEFDLLIPSGDDDKAKLPSSPINIEFSQSKPKCNNNECVPDQPNPPQEMAEAVFEAKTSTEIGGGKMEFGNIDPPIADSENSAGDICCTDNGCEECVVMTDCEIVKLRNELMNNMTEAEKKTMALPTIYCDDTGPTTMDRTGRYERVSQEESTVIVVPIIYQIFPMLYHSPQFNKSHKLPQSHSFLFSFAPELENMETKADEKITTNNGSDDRISRLNLLVEELSSQLSKTRLSLEGVEMERDYYFGKLRDIEVFCKDENGQDQNNAYALRNQVLQIVYGTVDGFAADKPSFAYE